MTSGTSTRTAGALATARLAGAEADAAEVEVLAAVVEPRPVPHRRAAGLAAAYTAACGAVTTPAWIHLTTELATDRRIEADAIAEATSIY